MTACSNNSKNSVHCTLCPHSVEGLLLDCFINHFEHKKTKTQTTHALSSTIQRHPQVCPYFPTSSHTLFHPSLLFPLFLRGRTGGIGGARKIYLDRPVKWITLEQALTQIAHASRVTIRRNFCNGLKYPAPHRSLSILFLLLPPPLMGYHNSTHNILTRL